MLGLALAVVAVPVLLDLTACSAAERRRQTLGADGWTVRPPLAYQGSDPEGVELRSGELTARRGTDTTTVLHESGPALVGGGTHSAVHVRRD